MTSVFNPSMLILARESRGLTQSKLSELIGLSQGKLSKVEKGLQTLPEDMLEDIAKKLAYPINFFFQTTPTSPVSHYYYRKKITIPQKTIMQIESSIKVCRRNIDILTESIELPEFPLPTFDSSLETPEEISRKVRYILNLPRGPIQNLTKLVENLGILVFKVDFLHDKMDGLSTVSEKGNHIIFLDSSMSNDRQRFSLAHELGHIVMHFDLPSPTVDVEDEANRFASEFLMPEEDIKPSLRYLNFSKLGDLKRYWKVSMKSLVYRAKILKTITEKQYRNFQINFSRKKININEPILLPEEEPFLIKEIIRLHLQNLNYSIDELSDSLFLLRQEFEELFMAFNKPKLKIHRIQ